jgi:hypothetical protein
VNPTSPSWTHAIRIGGRAAYQAVVLAASAGLLSVGAMVAGPPAGATEDFALNGKFTAVSDGQWAKVRERYQDVPSTTSTWTLSSTCNGPNDCQGTVRSDQGWTAHMRKPSQAWSVERIVPDWQRCPDGSTSPGRQLFRFWRVDEQGVPDLSGTSTLFSGEEKMLGVSGACGVNQWLTVRMPFLLRQID